ncbi:MAG: hypothetical protein NVS3B25_08550 [Hymenobacter sp.]
MQVPAEFPRHSFDLMLLSEVGYYWAPADLARAADRLVAGLRPGGQLLLVHWTAPVHDYPLTGDDVHEFFLTQAADAGPLRHLSGQRHAQYRLDLLEKQ